MYMTWSCYRRSFASK